LQGTTPNSPKRGPSFSSKGEKQAVLFQKSLSQEGLLNYIRNESMARALQESSGVKPLSDESDDFSENPFLLRNPSVLQNSWEIHVSNDEKPPTVSSIKVPRHCQKLRPTASTTSAPAPSPRTRTARARSASLPARGEWYDL
jgi:hypothetical protein